MKIDKNFAYDMFRFVHRPIRQADTEADNFLERYMTGMQTVWEMLDKKIKEIQDISKPEKCRADLLYYLKDIVGLTRELGNITDGLSEDDLRKIILLAVPLWKSKGIEIGFGNIVKLFTGFDSRIFNYFDYRMIVGEKAIGEEQLGEDAWMISRAGVEGHTPQGLALLILQFNNRNVIKDGSVHANPITAYGDYSWQIGGPFSTSDYYLRGLNFYLVVKHRAIYDFSSNWTMETQFNTDAEELIPLFHKWDYKLGKGIKITVNTITKEFTFKMSDGVTTQTLIRTVTQDLSDNTWHHIATIVDWEVDDGKVAMWVDGERIIFVDTNNALITNEINNDADLIIGEIEQGGEGSQFSVDGLRITNDARYDVDMSNITIPGVNFVEYQEEQLDEFQMDIRVVDNGTLDRTLLKRILNEMRGASERLNILYINFYDQFENGKGQYRTIMGSAYGEKTDNVYYMKMPENSLEHAEVEGSDDWMNYVVQHRCTIYDGDSFEVRFLIQDDLNYYAFRVNTLTKLAHFEKAVGGTRTALSSPVTVDIESATPPTYVPYYVFMVSSTYNVETGITTLKAFIDSNKIFDIDNNEYNKGTFGLFTLSGTTIWCSEAEMFQMPLDYDRINPNDEY